MRHGLQRNPRVAHATATPVDERLRLVGAIAHDFNNLLTVVETYSGFALTRLDDREAVRGHLDEIRKAGRCGTELTRRLLAVSEGRPPEDGAGWAA